MEILASQLGQLLKLRLYRLHNLLVAVAEVDGRVPHLEIEIWLVLAVIEEASFTALKELRRGRVVRCITMRAVLRFLFAEYLFAESDLIYVIHTKQPTFRKRRSVTSVSVSNGSQATPWRSHHSRSPAFA